MMTMVYWDGSNQIVVFEAQWADLVALLQNKGKSTWDDVTSFLVLFNSSGGLISLDEIQKNVKLTVSWDTV